MAEKIGNIIIEDNHYPGEDLYSDGAVEDEILEIVRTNSPSSYGEIIEAKKSWPVLYHLSRLRENIVDWIPVGKADKVLEVGSGCGAITGALSAKAGSVTCIELSRKRSLINAYRHPDCDNVTIKLGNFQDIEPELPCDYDYIFLIGVFEYGQSYIGGSSPFETFLTIMKKHLAPNGRLIIAIENRLGMKYWAGCREDHTGVLFDGIEGYPKGSGVRTFTRKALEEICHATGTERYSFYYPYPDYKFMTCLYSDDRLPQVGELCDNMRNFDRDRLLFLDEKNAFDSVIREGEFPLFSNSYLLVIGEPLPVSYARFSNDRAERYAVCTQIRKRTDGQETFLGADSLEVRKVPLTEKAQAHIKRMKETYDKLRTDYAGSGLEINHCSIDGTEAVFDYVPGRTLEELLDDCLDKKEEEAFDRLFDRYCALVRYPKTPSVYNCDLIFSNIIVSGERWHLIDYEWVSEKEITAQDTIVRALYCYGIGSIRRRDKSLALIMKVTGCQGEGEWNESFLKEIVAKEKIFQKRCTGNRMSMTEMRNAIGKPVVPVISLTHRYLEERWTNRIQVYEDYGEGFSEEHSYFIEEGYEERKTITVDICEGPGLRAVRLDPSLDYCIVYVKELMLDGQVVSLADHKIKLNGKLISDKGIVFPTQDPNITIFFETEEKGFSLHAEMEITHVSKETAESMAAGQEQEGQEKREKREKRGFRKGLAWFLK